MNISTVIKSFTVCITPLVLGAAISAGTAVMTVGVANAAPPTQNQINRQRKEVQRSLAFRNKLLQKRKAARQRDNRAKKPKFRSVKESNQLRESQRRNRVLKSNRKKVQSARDRFNRQKNK